MSDQVYIHDIGSMIRTITTVQPQSSGAATINGGSVDRAAHHMPMSCRLHQAVGAVSGSPSATSVTTKLQDSADGTTFADYTDPNTSAVPTTAAVTAQNTENGVSVDLSNARRYVRGVTTVAFTGGTSPAALVVSEMIFGGEALLPST